jgi:RNA 2',3'-cyclic 3'-phosphodiesterase
MRLFTGIPLNNATRGEIAALVARIAPRVEGWRWSAVESWHITLQFLGETTAKACACVVERMGAIEAAAVPVEPGGFGVFDPGGVFYVEVALTAELAVLQLAVTEATARCGFATEARPYHPHITLARVQNGARGNPAAGRAWHLLRERLPEGTRFTASVAREFVLYESFPDPGGSRYEARGRFALG